MDAINARFGADCIYLAAMHHSRHAAPMRIAFTRIPDLAVESPGGDKWGVESGE